MNSFTNVYFFFQDSAESDSDNGEDPLVIDIAEALKPKAANDSETDSCDSNEKKNDQNRTEDLNQIRKPEASTNMKQLKNYVNFYKVTKIFEQKIQSLKSRNKHKMHFSMSSLSEVKEAFSNPQNESLDRINCLKKWKSESNLNDCASLDFNLEHIRELLIGKSTSYEQIEFVCEPLLSIPAIENEEIDSNEKDPLSIDNIEDIKPLVANLLDSKEGSPKKGSIKLRKITDLVDDRKILKTRLNIPVKFDLKNMKVIGQSNLLNKSHLANASLRENVESSNNANNDGFNPKIEAAFSLAGTDTTKDWNTSPQKNVSIPDINQVNLTPRLKIPSEQILSISNSQQSAQNNVFTKVTDNIVSSNATKANFNIVSSFQKALKNVNKSVVLPNILSKAQILPKQQTLMNNKSPIKNNSPPKTACLVGESQKIVSVQPHYLNVLDNSALSTNTEQNKGLNHPNTASHPRRILQIGNNGKLTMCTQNTVQSSNETPIKYSQPTKTVMPVLSESHFLVINTKGNTEPSKKSLTNNSFTTSNETIIGNMKLVKPINVPTSQNNIINNTKSPDKSISAILNSSPVISTKSPSPQLSVNKNKEPIFISSKANDKFLSHNPSLWPKVPDKVCQAKKQTTNKTGPGPLSKNASTQSPPNHDLDSGKRIQPLPSLSKITPPPITVSRVESHAYVPKTKTTIDCSKSKSIPIESQATFAKKSTIVQLAGNPTNKNQPECSLTDSTSGLESVELVASNLKSAVPSSSTIAKTKLLFRKDIPKKQDFMKLLGPKYDVQINPARKHSCLWCKTR